MKLQKILLGLLFIVFSGCSGMGSGMGMKTHRPNLQSSLEITKRDGLFRIIAIKGETADINNVLNKDLLNCNSTTFSMPRGHTVGSFIKEIFEKELQTAQKFSSEGSGITVVIKSLDSDTSRLEKGSWTIVIDYIEDDKITGIKTVTTYESKFSLLSACVNTANVFEEALADNFVEFFKRTR